MAAVGARGAIAPPPPAAKFWAVRKFSSRSAKFGSEETPRVWETFGAKLKFLATYNVLCRKFASVCWKSAASCPACGTFFTRRRRWSVPCELAVTVVLCAKCFDASWLVLWTPCVRSQRSSVLMLVLWAPCANNLVSFRLAKQWCCVCICR